MNESCDVCARPVDFNPADRTFSHTTTSRCRGIDGIVLSEPHPDPDRAENRRTVMPPLRLINNLTPQP